MGFFGWVFYCQPCYLAAGGEEAGRRVARRGFDGVAGRLNAAAEGFEGEFCQAVSTVVVGCITIQVVHVP